MPIVPPFAQIVAMISVFGLVGAMQPAPITRYLNSADASPREAIITEARRILSAKQESHYSHVTHVEESTGTCDVDCSGLLCCVLKRVAPDQLKNVPISERHKRPLALQFFEAFTHLNDAPKDNGWEQIHRLADAKPGDVLVWRRAEQKAGEDTGHVMIVDEAPVADGDALFRVTVIDSSESPHGKDTRAEGENGVGRGQMWFAVDEKGEPVAYHWKLKHGKPHTMTVAIGRAIGGS